MLLEGPPQAAVRGHAHILTFEPDPFDSGLPDKVREPLAAGADPVDPEVGRLAFRLLNVAEVCGQYCVSRGDQEISCAAAKPRQISAVFRRGDKEGIQSLLFKGGSEVV